MKWHNEGVVPYQEYAKTGEKFGVYPFGAIMVSRFDDYSMIE